MSDSPAPRPPWFIDALNAAAGRAFITQRAETQTLADDVAPPVFVSAPHFLVKPVANPGTALAAERAGFQMGVFTRQDRQLEFGTLEEAIEFVRRIYARVGGTGRDGGGDRKPGPRPVLGGDAAAAPFNLKQRGQYDPLMTEIEDFSANAELPANLRQKQPKEYAWQHIVRSIKPMDWDDLVDWGLEHLWGDFRRQQAMYTSEEFDSLSQRYDDAVFAVGPRFYRHLQRPKPPLPWLHGRSPDAHIDRFDLLAAIPAPSTPLLVGQMPASLAEFLALVVATPTFVRNSLEGLAMALVAGSVVAHLPTLSCDGYVGNLGIDVMSAGAAGASWLADNWPRFVQSKEAEEIIRDVVVAGGGLSAMTP